MFGRGLIYQFQMTIPVTVQGLGPCPLPQSVIDRSADAQREEKERKKRKYDMRQCPFVFIQHRIRYAQQ